MLNEVAGNIGIAHFVSAKDVNEWLRKHHDLEVLDIKFSASETSSEVLIICRLEE